MEYFSLDDPSIHPLGGNDASATIHYQGFRNFREETFDHQMTTLLEDENPLQAYRRLLYRVNRYLQGGIITLTFDSPKGLFSFCDLHAPGRRVVLEEIVD